MAAFAVFQLWNCNLPLLKFERLGSIERPELNQGSILKAQTLLGLEKLAPSQSQRKKFAKRPFKDFQV